MYSVRLLPLIIFLTSSLLGIAEEDFPVLSFQRKEWKEARSSAQAEIDKSYLSQLEELKKDLVKKGDLDAARAFDKAIKGEAKAEDEPATLTKMRKTRDKALEAAFKPVDKQYWEDLKLLKGYSQRQGDLERVESVISEINKVLAPYKQESAKKGFKPEPAEKLRPSLMRVDGNPTNYSNVNGKTKIKLKKGANYTFKARTWQPPGATQLNHFDHAPAFIQENGKPFPAGPEWEIYDVRNKSQKFDYGKKDKDGWYDYSCNFDYNIDHKGLMKFSLYKKEVVFFKDIKLIDNETGENILDENFATKKHWQSSANLSFSSAVYPTNKTWPDLKIEEVE